MSHIIGGLLQGLSLSQQSTMPGTPIPTPPAVPFLGHVNTIDKDLPIRSLDLLARQYGEIYQLNVLG